MSWQLAVLRPWLRWTVRPVAARIRNWTVARWLFRVSARVAFRRTCQVVFESAGGDLAPGLWVRPELGAGSGVLLFLHGGAYIVGDAWTYRDLAGQLARLTGCAVCLPDYPLAPEHPAPAAFDAAVGVWKALIRAGHRADQIVICGDSAGGGLSLALLSHLLRHDQRPAGCVAFAPWTDLSLSGASLVRNAPRDVILPAERIEEVRGMVLGDLDPLDPRVSPLFADFPGCPPVFLSLSRSEILHDDVSRMAETLTAQGAEVTVEILPNAPHVWQLFHGRLPEADAALVRTAAWIRRVLAPHPESGS